MLTAAAPRATPTPPHNGGGNGASHSGAEGSPHVESHRTRHVAHGVPGFLTICIDAVIKSVQVARAGRKDKRSGRGGENNESHRVWAGGRAAGKNAIGVALIAGWRSRNVSLGPVSQRPHRSGETSVPRGCCSPHRLLGHLGFTVPCVVADLNRRAPSVAILRLPCRGTLQAVHEQATDAFSEGPGRVDRSPRAAPGNLHLTPS